MALKMPRMPKVTFPSSLNPVDVVQSLGATERELIQALVVEPLTSLGVSVPPAPTTPGEMAAQALGRNKSTPTFTPTPTATTMVQGKKVTTI